MQFTDRLRDKIQRENLWFFILLLLSSQDRYGYELRGLLKTKFGFWSGNVTAYRVLYALEKRRLVRAEMRDRRRYYTITELGRRELRLATELLRSLVRESEESEAQTIA